ncbi:MAG: undecaprenyl-diphosphate phosphatase [Methylobacteriaceae bacterium]|nr:undecaprenyl-diphosphate phosphatase [Methylobacteriaceae bacterium]
MSLLQILIFALVQGVTELFPVSSVAHGVLTPHLFGWNLDPVFLKEHFLPFVVMLHLGTAIALLLFFWRDWLDVARSLVDARAAEARATLVRLVVATLPAAIIGLAFERALRGLFSSVTAASFFLIVNGVLLFLGERARGRGERRISELGLGQAAFIGFMQSLALVPGFSRSGATMIAGFWAGLTHAEAARFSMLLATPLIAGASLLEVPKLARASHDGLFTQALIGGAASGLFALVAVWALMRWFARHEVNAMWPFAMYCVVLGSSVLLAAVLS